MVVMMFKKCKKFQKMQKVQKVQKCKMCKTCKKCKKCKTCKTCKKCNHSFSQSVDHGAAWTEKAKKTIFFTKITIFFCNFFFKNALNWPQIVLFFDKNCPFFVILSKNYHFLTAKITIFDSKNYHFWQQKWPFLTKKNTFFWQKMTILTIFYIFFFKNWQKIH